MLSSGSFVDVLCGQPEQKNGSRTAEGLISIGREFSCCTRLDMYSPSDSLDNQFGQS